MSTRLHYIGPLRPYPTVQLPATETNLAREVTVDDDGIIEVPAPVAAQMVATGEWRPAGQKRRTVAKILADVDGDPDKATAALVAEQAETDPRPSLVEKLQAIADTAAPTNLDKTEA